jgi:Rod binding domain-containing protein
MLSDAAFGNLYDKVRKASSKANTPASLEDAGHQMEVVLTTFMLKTMEASSSEGGLLGTKSQGMGYFKDMFLETIAEEVVRERGLGFGEALVNAYGTKDLTR